MQQATRTGHQYHGAGAPNSHPIFTSACLATCHSTTCPLFVAQMPSNTPWIAQHAVGSQARRFAEPALLSTRYALLWSFSNHLQQPCRTAHRFYSSIVKPATCMPSGNTQSRLQYITVGLSMHNTHSLRPASHLCRDTLPEIKENKFMIIYDKPCSLPFKQ